MKNLITKHIITILFVIILIPLVIASRGCGSNMAFKQYEDEMLEAENRGLVETELKAQNKTITKEDVVGTYDAKIWPKGGRLSFLDNGRAVAYKNGQEIGEIKWEIVDNEVHVGGGAEIYRVESSGDLTLISSIKEGSRIEHPKKFQLPWKKQK